MSGPRNRRWVCSCGNNVLGPGRMRRDDVRRYCLPCSERTGRLVQRTCPALERERMERHKRKATKAREAHERAVAAVAHLTLAKQLRSEVAGLRALNAEGVQVQPNWLALRDGGDTHNVWGRAGRTGHVYVGKQADDVSVAEVLIHEFCHTVLVRTGQRKGNRGRRDWHGQRFRGLLLAACMEYFGGITETEVLDLYRRLLRAVDARAANCKANGLRWRKPLRAYILDEAIRIEARGTGPVGYWARLLAEEEELR